MNDTIKKVLKYIKAYRLFLAGSLVMALLYVCATLYIPILIGRGIDCIVGIGEVDFTMLLKYIGVIAIVMIVGGVAQWIMNVCNNQITYGVIRDIRQQAFEHIHEIPLSYLDKTERGDMVSRMIADVDQFADGLLMGFTQFFTGVITIAGTLIFMLSINPVITIVVVALTPVSFLVASFVANHTHDMFALQSKVRGEQTAFMDEVITNQKLVKAFGREAEITDEFEKINERLGECSLRATFYSSLLNPSTRFVNSLVYAAVAIVGALFVIGADIHIFGIGAGGISVGMLTSFLSYASQYTKPFNEISGVITELQNALVCAGRVFELIEVDSEVDSEVMSTTTTNGNITLEGVSFSYVPEKPLIEDLNLNVKAGNHIAIVGPTGCGKTTLINLLMRFYDINSGKIVLDGIDVNEIDRRELRRKFGMVLQETWIRKGTVFDNITLGRDISREDVIAAAKATHAHSFIKRMKKGYDTFLAEDDGSLSAGQKQLLCITRVMAAIPPMLILDEATSSIDKRTEKEIASAFDRMMEGRTTFIVAHRLSTILNADMILCMRDGHIVEMGRHEELLAKKGFYYNLYNSQYSV